MRLIKNRWFWRRAESGERRAIIKGESYGYHAIASSRVTKVTRQGLQMGGHKCNDIRVLTFANKDADGFGSESGRFAENGTFTLSKGKRCRTGIVHWGHLIRKTRGIAGKRNAAFAGMVVIYAVISESKILRITKCMNWDC